MSLLGERQSAENKSIRSQAYNADWVYGPQGGITATEIADLKDGDYDRETGARKCAFCRQPRPLLTGNGTTCDAYCEKQQHGGIHFGKVYHWDKEQRGREWLTLG